MYNIVFVVPFFVFPLQISVDFSVFNNQLFSFIIYILKTQISFAYNFFVSCFLHITCFENFKTNIYFTKFYTILHNLNVKIYTILNFHIVQFNFIFKYNNIFLRSILFSKYKIELQSLYHFLAFYSSTYIISDVTHRVRLHN